MTATCASGWGCDPPVTFTQPRQASLAPAVDNARLADAIEAAVEAQVHEDFAAAGRSPRSPEARALIAAQTEAMQRARGVWTRSYARLGPGSRAFRIIRRVVVGAYNDGFIHAGNLAYLALIALFPFMILTTALLGAAGSAGEREAVLTAIFSAMPPAVAETLSGPIHEAQDARSGPLLWLGALVALWTVGSLIETVRDILRRAYGTQFTKSFWHYRLMSIAIIIAAVVLLLLSFTLQFLIAGLERWILIALPPALEDAGLLFLSRLVTAIGLFAALYLLFLSLTPSKYRSGCPKWPGALVTTLWWVAVTLALPRLLGGLLSYDLTYGSLAGVMVVLFFFYLVGLGVVVGAELNAALVEPASAMQEPAAHDPEDDDDG